MEQSLDTRAVTLTKTFCNHLAATTYESLTPAAVRECKRGILDWLGCALAGSPHSEIDITLETLKLNGGRPVATVIGRGLKLGLLEAPIANGQMGHLLDYDDTHMGGVVLHASSPILAALFALAEHLDEVRGATNPGSTPVSGREFMLAYATGFEAGVRVGRTAPGHHDGGWHLTGTLGTIAAGAACAKLLGLTGQQMTYALAIAATQAALVWLRNAASPRTGASCWRSRARAQRRRTPRGGPARVGHRRPTGARRRAPWLRTLAALGRAPRAGDAHPQSLSGLRASRGA
jgi:2-methylcitrate dehydratase PrpD